MTDPLAFDSHRPPLRVMALHALAYCERLFYLEEVEELYLADDRVYAGRELHESLAAGDPDEDGRPVALELASHALGLVGKVDAIKRRDGQLIPYEHKRGRAKRNSTGEACAWDTDALQVAAYAVMIEEVHDTTVPEGRVRYHKEGVTVRVPIDEAARQRLTEAVNRANELRQRIDRPPVAGNENLCRRCALAPVCLPEEVRQAEKPSREARRLFPEQDTRSTLHVLSPGARVSRDAECLVVTPLGGTASRHPSGEVGGLILHGMAQVSTQALRLCADREIAVHWFTQSGRHLGSLTATAGQVQRRIRQYRALAGPESERVRLRLARQLVVARLDGQRRYLLRATRQDGDRRERIRTSLQNLAQASRKADGADDIDTLRGHEGAGGASYWSAFDVLLVDRVPDELRFTKRTRRPARDPLNALLNFGYGLLRTAVMKGVLSAGLEPALGFYHTPRSAAHPLVLDLMELFRVPLWDMPLVGALNRGQFDPIADFVSTRGGIWLSDDGRRKVIGLFEDRLGETWKHPVVGYSLSYSRTIELEARLLEKEWSGEPGLFARLRLR